MACYPLTILCLLHCAWCRAHVQWCSQWSFFLEIFLMPMLLVAGFGNCFPLAYFFRSVPLFSASEWDDLSVKLIQALELCQAVGNQELWSTRVTKIRCSCSYAYLIVRDDWFSDNLAHNHHTVTTRWPFSPVIKTNWCSPCRLVATVVVAPQMEVGGGADAVCTRRWLSRKDYQSSSYFWCALNSTCFALWIVFCSNSQVLGWANTYAQQTQTGEFSADNAAVLLSSPWLEVLWFLMLEARVELKSHGSFEWVGSRCMKIGPHLMISIS